MNKKLIIKRCVDCPFNDHGQEKKVPIMRSYLGYNFKEYFGTSLGGPQLECWYNPRVNVRRNVRGERKLNFIIWKSSWDDNTEFKKQLNGFPKRCPLKDD